MMDVYLGGASLTFVERVLRLQERVTHRVAVSAAEREAVFRLRAEAYKRAGMIGHDAGQFLIDEKYDFGANAWITTTYVDGELAGTARVNLGNDPDAVLPSMQVYSDLVWPHLKQHRVLVELSRLAADFEMVKAFPQLAYLIIRPSFLAATHFDVDFAIAAPRAEHLAFYKRVFHFEPWATPRDYPGLTVRPPFAGMDFQAQRASVEKRYPFYISTREEREALFGPAERILTPRSRQGPRSQSGEAAFASSP